VKSWIVLVGLGIAANADAGVYADAFAKSDKSAIATLRDKHDDVAARCTLGAIYAKKADLSRAALYLTGCTDASLPEEISETVARAARDVTKKLRESQLSSIVISLEPAGTTLTAKITALPGETFSVPTTVWVKGGTYELEATDGELTYKQTITVGTFSRTPAIIDTTAKQKKILPPKTGKADFRDENAAEPQEKGSPPAVKRGSLMTKKQLGIVEPASGMQLEDPLDPRVYRRAPRPPRQLWLGLRLGGGMFDDGASDARIGGAVGATARYAIAPRYFLAGRFDWSRRGGGSIDVLGASAGAGATLIDGSIGVALIAQLRADLRFGDQMDVSTAGASAAANLELTLPSTPITAGIRFEQGLTEILPGARDRALLLEVGVDWR
jgi:hypothetical protein